MADELSGAAYVAARRFRADGEDYVVGQPVFVEQITNGYILKEAGVVVLKESEAGQRALANHELYHGAAARDRVQRFTEALQGDAPKEMSEGESPANSTELTPDLLTIPAEHGRDRLLVAGYDSDKAVRKASDEELLDIDGIGPKKLAQIRSDLASE